MSWAKHWDNEFGILLWVTDFTIKSILAQPFQTVYSYFCDHSCCAKFITIFRRFIMQTLSGHNKIYKTSIVMRKLEHSWMIFNIFLILCRISWPQPTFIRIDNGKQCALNLFTNAYSINAVVDMLKQNFTHWLSDFQGKGIARMIQSLSCTLNELEKWLNLEIILKISPTSNDDVNRWFLCNVQREIKREKAKERINPISTA